MEFFVQLTKKFIQLCRIRFVQVAARFIRKHKGRAIHERTGNRNTLAFTARKFTRQMLEAVLEPDRFQKHLGTFATFLFRLPKNATRHANVFERRKFSQQMMELEHESHMRTVVHVAFFAIELAERFTVEINFTRRWRIEHSYQIQERRFTGTRRTCERHKLPRLHRKIHALENFKFLTRLGEYSAKIDRLQ